MRRKIERWFELEKFQEAIEGQNDYLIPDHHYGVHDQTLVLHNLILWSLKNNQQEKISLLFMQILKSYFSKNIANALRLLINYRYACIDTGEELLIKPTTISSTVNSLVLSNFIEISASSELRTLLSTVKKYYPDVK